MRDKLQGLIKNYINEVGHFGDEIHHNDSHLILSELNEQLSVLKEDSRESCMGVISEFQKNKPESKELLNDFLTYIKYHNK